MPASSGAPSCACCCGMPPTVQQSLVQHTQCKGKCRAEIKVHYCCKLWAASTIKPTLPGRCSHIVYVILIRSTESNWTELNWIVGLLINLLLKDVIYQKSQENEQCMAHKSRGACGVCRRRAAGGEEEAELGLGRLKFWSPKGELIN